MELRIFLLKLVNYYFIILLFYILEPRLLSHICVFPFRTKSLIQKRANSKNLGKIQTSSLLNRHSGKRLLKIKNLKVKDVIKNVPRHGGGQIGLALVSLRL